jgi:uncharacterized protein (TIGR02453 family)
MPATFPGFDPKALAFFRKLAKNNDRDWFKAHKSEYDKLLKEPMLQLLGVLNAGFARFAPDHVTEPKKAIYRIYRDTRFTKSKIPLKLNISAMFGHRLLPKNYCAGYYFHVSATEVAIGVGLYMPEPEQLKAIRQTLADDHKPFLRLINDKKLVKTMGKLAGESLQRVPRDFPADHPAADLLRMKQFHFYRELDPKVALSSQIIKEVRDSFAICAPFTAYLNNIILSLHAADQSDPETPRRPKPMF